MVGTSPSSRHEHQHRGIGLLNHMVSQLRRAGISSGKIQRITAGPHFEYADGVELFLGRRGRGSLHIAWDTNLLIDYFDFGEALWHQDSLADVAPGARGEQLEALQVIVSVWIVRNIQFHLLNEVLSDARGELSERRRSERLNGWQSFCQALELVDDREEPREPPLFLSERALQDALERVPKGADRRLLEASVRGGMHVFMTCDKGILSARQAFRPFGVLIGTPGDVLEALASAGAVNCMLAPEHLYWPTPDLLRVAHLIEALPSRA